MLSLMNGDWKTWVTLLGVRSFAFGEFWNLMLVLSIEDGEVTCHCRDGGAFYVIVSRSENLFSRVSNLE